MAVNVPLGQPLFKYSQGERYAVQFDKINTEGASLASYEKCLEAKRKQAAKREAKWLAESIELPGVPGRCVPVESKDVIIGMGGIATYIAWKSHVGSKVYYYNDIQCLSGTAGYVVIQDGKVVHQQVTMMS